MGFPLTDLVTEAADTPIRGCGVDGIDDIGVEMGTLSKCPVERHLTNFSAHSGLSKLCNGELGVLDSIGGLVNSIQPNCVLPLYSSIP